MQEFIAFVVQVLSPTQASLSSAKPSIQGKRRENPETAGPAGAALAKRAACQVRYGLSAVI